MKDGGIVVEGLLIDFFDFDANKFDNGKNDSKTKLSQLN